MSHMLEGTSQFYILNWKKFFRLNLKGKFYPTLLEVTYNF
jgi:hypothetical protein